MVNTQDMEQMDMQAVDVVPSDISDKQLDQLKESCELRSDVQMLQDLKTELQRRHAPIDVEARLKQFHLQHPRMANSAGRRRRYRSVVVPLLLSAAVLAGVAFLLFGSGWETSDKHTIFTADREKQHISLANDKGEQIVLSSPSSPRRLITMDDFRKVMPEEGTMERVTLNVPYGNSADITLPDGSIAYMHPGSRLVFPTRFTGKKREVIFQGEAYFKITKDAAHPFVVRTERMETTVLGTEFNINTARDEATLITGSIRMKAVDHDAEILVKPHQQVSLSGDAFTVSTVDVAPYEFWRDGYLYFDNVEFQDIMEAIGKNFNMTVVFRDQKALHYRMRFIAERNRGVDNAIEMMNRMKKVTVSKSGNTIYVD